MSRDESAAVSLPMLLFPSLYGALCDFIKIQLKASGVKK